MNGVTRFTDYEAGLLSAHIQSHWGQVLRDAAGTARIWVRTSGGDAMRATEAFSAREYDLKPCTRTDHESLADSLRARKGRVFRDEAGKILAYLPYWRPGDPYGFRGEPPADDGVHLWEYDEEAGEKNRRSRYTVWHPWVHSENCPCRPENEWRTNIATPADIGGVL